MAQPFKSSLSLVCDYSSGEESEKEAENIESRPEKQKNSDERFEPPSRLPLPEQFQNIPKRRIDDYVEDNPEEHSGRSRSFPHERGNWVSYIYIPYQENYGFEVLCDLITDFYLPKIKMKKIDEPHISLTKTFILLHHWISQFVESARDSVKVIPRFQLTFDGIKVYCNEDKTRTFVGFTVGCGEKELLKSVELLRVPVRDYKLDAFYEEPSFHMSVVWCLGDLKSQIEEKLPVLRQKYYDFLKNRGDGDNICSMFVDSYICKTGFRLYKLQLD